MVNVEVKEFKIGLNGEEYTFRLDFKALLKFNSKYKNSIDIFNEFLQGGNRFGCVVKILTCCCVERDFTEEELMESLGFSFKVMKLIEEIGFSLMEGILSDEKGDKNKKN